MKIVRFIPDEVEIYEIKQMLDEYSGFNEAFHRMMESEELQRYLAEYLELLQKEAEKENLVFTPEMKGKFFEEVREILLFEIDKAAISLLMKGIHTNGILPNQIAEKMHKILIEEEFCADGKYSNIIKEYLDPTLMVKKNRKPKKTPVQQMLAIISAAD